MKMFKIGIFLTLVFFSYYLKAVISTPYGNTPEKYLSSKDTILFVVKISGSMSYGLYSEYLDDYTSWSKDKIKERWKILTGDIKDKYLVLGVIKGSSLRVGDTIITPKFYQFIEDTVTGGRYILFMEKENKKYKSKACDYANLNDLSSKELYQFSKLELGGIVEKVLNKFLMICTEEPIN